MRADGLVLQFRLRLYGTPQCHGWQQGLLSATLAIHQKCPGCSV